MIECNQCNAGPEKEIEETTTHEVNGGAKITCLFNEKFHHEVIKEIEFLDESDTVIQAAEIETCNSSQYKRFLLIVKHPATGDEAQHAVVGIHSSLSSREIIVGFVKPVFSDMVVQLKGDGQFQISSRNQHDTHSYWFKPSSIQGMWRVTSKLYQLVPSADTPDYASHAWLEPYSQLITQDRSLLSEWSSSDEQSTPSCDKKLEGRGALNSQLKPVLVDIMTHMVMDELDDISCVQLRHLCEERIGQNLRHLKEDIDSLIIEILGQMEKASKIFDFMYLGSEWNAQDFESLSENNVKQVLNAAGEIENFFPESLSYFNIRVPDIPSTDLMRYFDDTFQFIKKAQLGGHAVLVHCKMGVSRSATIVIAFAMKEYHWTLEDALKYVKSQRGVVHPNEGFMKQLQEYEGILCARNNEVWGALAASSSSSMPCSR